MVVLSGSNNTQMPLPRLVDKIGFPSGTSNSELGGVHPGMFPRMPYDEEWLGSSDCLGPLVEMKMMS